MEEKNDIYDMNRLQQYWNDRIDSNDQIVESNKNHLHNFFNRCFSAGLSNARVLVYQNRLVPVAEMIEKDFLDMTEDDLFELLGKIEKNTRWSEGTKNMFRVAIKKLYKVLEGKGRDYPEKVRFISTTQKNHRKRLPDELLTREEIQKLINVSESARDKALIAILAESGARITELANMRIKHIVFDEYGALVLFPFGKTGARRVRLINGVHYLVSWLENHPAKDDRDALVWCFIGRAKGEPMTYRSITARLEGAAKNAGISKRCNPHAFRHARATELVKKGLNDAQICSLMGWTLGSRQLKTYVHLASRDNDTALLKAYGIKRFDDKEKSYCPRCSKELQAGLRFCGSCGMPVTLNAAVELEEKRTELEEKSKKIMDLLGDKDVQELLAQKLAEA